MFLDTSTKAIAKYLLPDTQTKWILLFSLFIMATGNLSLCQNLLKTYPFSFHNLPFLLSLIIFFFATIAIVLQILCIGRVAKWILAVLLVLASINAYFMDSFGIVIDHTMMDNVAQTDLKEMQGLVSIELLARLVLLGLIPAYLVIKFFPEGLTFKQEIKGRFKAISTLGLTTVMVVIPFTAGYASFIREHKIVRFYANPTYSIYATYKYLNQEVKLYKARNEDRKSVV